MEFLLAGVVKTASLINYETLSVAERTVLITVVVRDTGALSDTTTLTVSIIDQNEAPAFPKTTYTLVTDEAGVIVLMLTLLEKKYKFPYFLLSEMVF